ncbi:MAG: zinc-binding dehydrogenase [Burkholderiales bacterium]
MLALRKTRPAPGLELCEAPEPRPPGAGEVLLQVRATGVCGTDLHIDEWTPSYRFAAPSLPVTVGHEFSATVHTLGAGVTGLAPGSLVAVRPSVVCGTCVACVIGDFDACTTRRGTGVTRDGAFAARVLVPARNCVPVPGGLDDEVAALAEPMTVSHESARTGEVRPGQRVLVLGPGNIGLGIAVFARAAGAAQVVAAGRHDVHRLATARAMGFDHTLDFGDDDMSVRLAPLVAEGGFDVVFEATGAAAVIAPALAALKPHGILVVTGIHAAPVPIDLTALLRRHQQIRGSYRAPEAAWSGVLEFMRSHQATLRHMITRVLPLHEAHEAIALSRSRMATKVMIRPAT